MPTTTGPTTNFLDDFNSMFPGITGAAGASVSNINNLLAGNESPSITRNINASWGAKTGIMPGSEFSNMRGADLYGQRASARQAQGQTALNNLLSTISQPYTATRGQDITAALEREKMGQNESQFSRSLGQSSDQFAQQLGFNREQLAQQLGLSQAELAQREREFGANLGFNREQLAQQLGISQAELAQREREYADQSGLNREMWGIQQQFLPDILNILRGDGTTSPATTTASGQAPTSTSTTWADAGPGVWNSPWYSDIQESLRRLGMT